MLWLKRDMWKVAIAVPGMLLLLVFMVWVPVSVAGAYEGVSGLATPTTGTVKATPTVQATPTIDPSVVAATAKEQLRKLQHDNDRSFQAWFWSSGATFLSALVLVFGGLFGLWRWLVERRDAQEQQKDQLFQNTIAGLGSERIEARAIAASMMLTFLQQPGYERFHQQIFNLAVTNLRLHHVDPSTPEPLDSLSQALITVFKESFPLVRKALMDQKKSQFDPQKLDASRIRLDNAYLWKADLEQVWMPLASLRKADLGGAHLCKAKLSQADLRSARLDKAILKAANLSGAKLNGADLSEADLSKANLGIPDLSKAEQQESNRDGADLSGSNLSWAHLNGVNLEEADLSEADLSGADLSNVLNFEKVRSLKDTNLHGVTGLTVGQLTVCRAKNAINVPHYSRTL